MFVMSYLKQFQSVLANGFGNNNKALPLSINQYDIWLEQQLHPLDFSNNAHFVAKIQEELHLTAFQRALWRLAERHEVIRTIYPILNSVPIRELVAINKVNLQIVECFDLSEDEIEKRIEENYKRPFDLSIEIPFRFCLYQRSISEYYFQIVEHHIGISLGYARLPMELASLYVFERDQKKIIQLENFYNYSKFILNQYEWFQSNEFYRYKDYWMQYLSGNLSNPVLPIDFNNQNFIGKVFHYNLDNKLIANLKEKKNCCNTTFFSLMTAAFQVLLYRYTKQEEVIVGIPTDGRIDGFNELIGYTTNTLPLRSMLSLDQEFSQFIKRVHHDMRNMSRHRLYPLPMIMEDLRLEKGSTFSQLFRAIVVSQKVKEYKEIFSFGVGKKNVTIDIDGFKYESAGMGLLTTGRFDLALAIVETSDGYVASFHYNGLVFKETTIRGLANNYIKLLESIVSDPNKKIGELSIVSDEEQYLQLDVWNSIEKDFKDNRDFINWFERRANENPEGIALVFEEKKIDYGTLNCLANQLARYLQSLGAKEETVIGVGVERSFELIICLLAIMKAGSAYLPLDPDHPKERLQFMLEDSQAEILITQQSLEDIFHDYQGKIIFLDRDSDKISEKSRSNLIINRDTNRLAYVLYTSGSTGKPKGVEIVQKSLDNLLASMKDELHLVSDDRWLAVTTISFDIANLEILLPLRCGATVVLANQEATRDPFLLSQIIEQKEITFVQATPSTWEMLVDSGWKGNVNLTALSGGESLSQTLADRLHSLVRVLWNMYGPTETTIWSSMKKIESKDEKITIGRPIANTTFYILDENKQIVPIGVPGELFIGGIGLARGYRKRPELTEERFIESPFTTNKLYRTGDLVRYLPNGEIDYLGRIDHQVKIHGYRIELGEIEEIIKKCPGVRQAIVIAREDTPGDKRIVTYFIGNCQAEEIRKTLALFLPNYMMPCSYVQLSQFPLNPSGKIDRKALPMPIYVLEDATYIFPRNSIEMKIAEIFQDLLGIDKVSIDANFFSLGGHSLLAARLVTQINNFFYIDLPLKTLLEKPTIALMAKEVEIFLSKGYCPSLITKVLREKGLSLSHSQKRLWFLDQLEQNSANYSIPFILDIEGSLERFSLQKSLDVIVQRHEILRTIFQEGDEGPEQFILPKIEVNLEYKDLSSNANPKKELENLILTEAIKPFILKLGPLFRFYLIRINKNHHSLFMNFHHIIFDGASINVFIKEFKDLYEAYKLRKTNPLQELDIQYVDFTYWQLNAINVEKKQISWWSEKLNDASLILNLPIDKPRPHIQTYNGALIEFLVGESNEITALKKLAQKYESTIFILLLSAFHLFLYRYTGQNDIVIGIPVSGRTHSKLDSLIGCFVNTLPLRTVSHSEDTFLNLLSKIRKEVFETFEHGDIPFEKIVENLKVERSLSHSPIFQVMFSSLPEIEINKIGDLEVKLHNVDRRMSHFDLSLSVQETSQGLIGAFEYNTDLFHKETIERMVKHFQHLISEIVKNPEQFVGKIPLLSDEEIHNQIIEWNARPIDYQKDETILQLFERWSEEAPNAEAVIYKGKSYSYRQINVEANRIAHTLLKLGLNKEDKIVVCLERSAEFIPAVLGVLKAGGVYIPIDPMEPKKRIDSILQDLKPFCILTHSTLKTHFSDSKLVCIDQLETLKIDNPLISICKDQLAYIIYTSGSTGKPKGVEIEHQCINDRVLWKKEAYPLSPKDVMLHTYLFIFDGAIINYFWPLCTGATLVIASKEELFDSSALVQLIQKYRVTTMDLLPSLLQGLLEEKEISFCHSLKNVFSGGEALSSETIHHFYERCCGKLHNTYGPTEATVEASAWECDANYVGPIAPIGKSIAGAKLYILDKDQNIVPIGVSGELHIGGIGLARGYLNNPISTDKKFIKDFFSNAKNRLYRTGDMAKYRADGNIEFLGREDSNQVKIRGFRIDLREIESVLIKITPIEKAIVSIKGDALHRCLIAYVVLSDFIDQKVFDGLIKHYLCEHLPGYMIPQQVVILDSFPVLLNGKINYKALPPPRERSFFSSHRECNNEVELQLLSIWKEVLALKDIAVTDNFFEIGGNSLLAMRLVTSIKKKMGFSIPLIYLFQNPTIETFSESINTQLPKRPWSPIVLMQPKGNKNPFFCVHPVGGGVLCYRALAKYWDEDRPFYAIQARGFEEGQYPNESIEVMAEEYIRGIREVQPNGPYLIGGWSFGGLIASEMVSQLLQQGEKVSLLVLIDSTANIEKIRSINIENDAIILSELSRYFSTKPIANKKDISPKKLLIQLIESGGKRANVQGQSSTDRLIALAKSNWRALQTFSIPTIDVNALLIRSESNQEKKRGLGWNKYIRKLKVIQGPGDHWAITEDDEACHYAKILQNYFSSFHEEEILIKI